MAGRGEPRTISREASELLGSPLNTLVSALLIVAIVFSISTTGYILAGWSLGDAAYMVVLTIFSVGYSEVRPVDTAYLRDLTSFTIVLGCTSMIMVTGALVQLLSAFQLRRILGIDRMRSQIGKLNDHVIICGYGRIGVQLAHELHEGKIPFILIERSAEKCAEAQAKGYLSICADATDEEILAQAGIGRARLLATVLPNDAANVFITLSARNLNSQIEIIARGEAPNTKGKLIHAGADKVVLPTHIGAERIIEMILYPETAQITAESDELAKAKRSFTEFGLELEAVSVGPDSVLAGATVAEAEQRAQGSFFVVQIDRQGDKPLMRPGPGEKLKEGDHVLLLLRQSNLSAGSIFSEKLRTYRGRRG